jgi:uncharacterized protein YcaQ
MREIPDSCAVPWRSTGWTDHRNVERLLSPLDRLVHDRGRMVEPFAFDDQLEMLEPVARHRWGYLALPD